MTREDVVQAIYRLLTDAHNRGERDAIALAMLVATRFPDATPEEVGQAMSAVCHVLEGHVAEKLAKIKPAGSA